jgi:pyruvate kinase
VSDGTATELLRGTCNHLLDLRRHILEAEKSFSDDIEAVPLEWRESARNLVHYLGLRKQDIRPLQIQLSYLGLGSDGRRPTL